MSEAQKVINSLIEYVSASTRNWCQADLVRIILPKENPDKKNSICPTADWEHGNVISFDDLSVSAQEKIWKHFLAAQITSVKKERDTYELEQEKQSLDKKITELLYENSSGTSTAIAHALKNFEERLQYVEGVYHYIINYK